MDGKFCGARQIGSITLVRIASCAVGHQSTLSPIDSFCMFPTANENVTNTVSASFLPVDDLNEIVDHTIDIEFNMAYTLTIVLQ